MVSGLARPLIADEVVKVAREVDAGTLAHGCTGKGNDQVRFELAFAVLAPDLEVLAPIRDATIPRDKAIALAAEWGIRGERRRHPVLGGREPVGPHGRVRSARGSMGRAAGGRVRTDRVGGGATGRAGRDHGLVRPGRARGPGRRGRGPAGDLIRALDVRGGTYGFGRVDLIENRRVGIKSRELYEVPGALAIIRAHRALEDLTLEREVAHHKPAMEQRWADLVYDGQWFSPLRAAIDAYVDATQTHVTGDVRAAVRAGDVHRRRPAVGAFPLRPVARDLRRRGRVRPVRLEGVRPARRAARSRSGPPRRGEEACTLWSGRFSVRPAGAAGARARALGRVRPAARGRGRRGVGSARRGAPRRGAPDDAEAQELAAALDDIGSRARGGQLRDRRRRRGRALRGRAGRDRAARGPRREASRRPVAQRLGRDGPAPVDASRPGRHAYGQVGGLGRVLVARAREHDATVMPGTTHARHAQPVTLGHHLLAHAWAFVRDLGRIDDWAARTDVSPLGAGAWPPRPSVWIPVRPAPSASGSRVRSRTRSTR